MDLPNRGYSRHFQFVRKLGFITAPRPEQSRVVAEIEKQFTRLDDAVAALKRVQADLKRYRASVLKAACEGRLVPTEAELARKEGRSYEPASELLKRILAERRAKWETDQLQKIIAAGKPPKDDGWKKKYIQPSQPDATSLPQLPTGWAWATVEQLGIGEEQTVLTGPFGTQLAREDFAQAGVPVLTIGCLTEAGVTLDRAMYVQERKAKQLDRYRLRTGDLLFSRMAAVGRAEYVTAELSAALFNYHIMRLRLDESAVNPAYFIAYVRGAATVTSYIRDVNHGATRDGINTEQLLSLPVALPPLREQRRIVTQLECVLSKVEKHRSDTHAALRHSDRLRQSILKQAFSGKLVPQDPNDEPASVLLERIRAERAAASANRNGTPMATTAPVTVNAQRRRRVARLAQRVSAGKR
jgi:type I restriction enzyme, S subunit